MKQVSMPQYYYRSSPYLLKPFSISYLEKCVANILSPHPPIPGMLEHSMVSVRIDAKPRASFDLPFDVLLHEDWLGQRKLLSQPSSSMLPPKLCPHFRPDSFWNGEFYTRKNIPTKTNQPTSQPWFALKCAATINYQNHFNNYRKEWCSLTLQKTLWKMQSVTLHKRPSQCWKPINWIPRVLEGHQPNYE